MSNETVLIVGSPQYIVATKNAADIWIRRPGERGGLQIGAAGRFPLDDGPLVEPVNLTPGSHVTATPRDPRLPVELSVLPGQFRSHRRFRIAVYE